MLLINRARTRKERSLRITQTCMFLAAFVKKFFSFASISRSRLNQRFLFTFIARFKKTFVTIFRLPFICIMKKLISLFDFFGQDEHGGTKKKCGYFMAGSRNSRERERYSRGHWRRYGAPSHYARLHALWRPREAIKEAHALFLWEDPVHNLDSRAGVKGMRLVIDHRGGRKMRKRSVQQDEVQLLEIELSYCNWTSNCEHCYKLFLIMYTLFKTHTVQGKSALTHFVTWESIAKNFIYCPHIEVNILFQK